MRKKGFTLIELLIVIAIIAILATVIIMNVANARVKATRAKIASDLSTAVTSYNACSAFGGTAQAAPIELVLGQPAQTICTDASTAITDLTERAVASGSWPTIVSGYGYADYGDPKTGHDTANAIAEVQKGNFHKDFNSSNNVYVVCTKSGCTTSADW